MGEIPKHLSLAFQHKTFTKTTFFYGARERAKESHKNERHNAAVRAANTRARCLQPHTAPPYALAASNSTQATQGCANIQSRASPRARMKPCAPQQTRANNAHQRQRCQTARRTTTKRAATMRARCLQNARCAAIRVSFLNQHAKSAELQGDLEPGVTPEARAGKQCTAIHASNTTP